MEVLKLQISKSNVKTRKFNNRYIGISIFLLFQRSFQFKTYQWVQDIQGNFLNIKYKVDALIKITTVQ